MQVTSDLPSPGCGAAGVRGASWGFAELGVCRPASLWALRTWASGGCWHLCPAGRGQMLPQLRCVLAYLSCPAGPTPDSVDLRLGQGQTDGPPSKGLCDATFFAFTKDLHSCLLLLMDEICKGLSLSPKQYKVKNRTCFRAVAAWARPERGVALVTRVLGS